MWLDTTTNERITLWREFRDKLEKSKTPFEDVQELWNTAPRTTKGLDPWNSQQWNSPWELLAENRFCPVSIPLMMGWTMKLTTRFTQENILIKTIVDHSNERVYNVIHIQETVLNVDNKVINIRDVPSDWFTQFQTEIR